jgi:hypothetical protein
VATKDMTHARRIGGGYCVRRVVMVHRLRGYDRLWVNSSFEHVGNRVVVSKSGGYRVRSVLKPRNLGLGRQAIGADFLCQGARITIPERRMDGLKPPRYGLSASGVASGSAAPHRESGFVRSGRVERTRP